MAESGGAADMVRLAGRQDRSPAAVVRITIGGQTSVAILPMTDLPRRPIGPLTPHLFRPDGERPVRAKLHAPAGRRPGWCRTPIPGARSRSRRTGVVRRDDAARHLHRSAVARALDPARRRARRDRGRGRRPADALPRTSRAGAAGPGRERRPRRRAGASAGCSKSRACCSPWRSSSTRAPDDAPRPPDARRRWRASAASPRCSLDELRRAPPVPLGVDLPQRQAAARACARPCSTTRRGTPRSTAWAGDAGASARTIARLFRSELGTTVRAAGASRCCSPARCRWRRGSMPMAAIAAELGYASPSAFAAMVRRSVGSSPMRFFRAEG